MRFRSIECASFQNSNRGLRALCVWILIAFAASILRHAPLLDAPFDRGIAGTMGGRIQGAIQKVWHQEGFLVHRGRPTIFPAPTKPISGPTYANHPVGFHWMERLFIWLFGFKEASFRFYPMIGCAFTTCMLVGWAYRRWSHMGAGIILALQLLSAGLLYYGSSANYESTTAVFILAIVMLAERTPSRPQEVMIFIFSFISVMHDWHGGLALLGLVCLSLSLQRVRLSTLISCAAGIAASVLVSFTLLIYWEGGFWAAVDSLKGAAEVSRTTDRSFTAIDFLQTQLVFVRDMWGWGALILPFILFARRLIDVSEARFLGSQLFAWCTMGIVWILMFPERSCDHEFWAYVMYPGFMLVQAGVLVALWQRAKERSWRLAICVAVSILVVLGAFLSLRDRMQSIAGMNESRVVKRFNQIVKDDDLLITSFVLNADYYYIKNFVLDGSRDYAVVRYVVDQLNAGSYPDINRVLVAVSSADRIFYDESTIRAEFPKVEKFSDPAGDLYVFNRW